MKKRKTKKKRMKKQEKTEKTFPFLFLFLFQFRCSLSSYFFSFRFFFLFFLFWEVKKNSFCSRFFTILRIASNVKNLPKHNLSQAASSVSVTKGEKNSYTLIVDVEVSWNKKKRWKSKKRTKRTDWRGKWSQENKRRMQAFLLRKEKKNLTL